MPVCDEHGHVYGEGCQCPECSKPTTELNPPNVVQEERPEKLPDLGLHLPGEQ